MGSNTLMKLYTILFTHSVFDKSTEVFVHQEITQPRVQSVYVSLVSIGLIQSILNLPTRRLQWKPNRLLIFSTKDIRKLEK